MDRNKQLFTLTAGEFVECLRQGLGDYAFEHDEPIIKKHYVYGLAGLAELLGCSQSTASRIHRSGVLSAATRRTGRIIIFDQDLVMDILQVRKRKAV